MIPDEVIPAFPYEGGFYWFAGASTTRHSRDHPYYRVLYGPDPDRTSVRAAALTCLFERIVIAPADHALPDWQTHLTARNYENADLRLSMSWDDNEWAPENVAIAKAVHGDPELRRLLESHPLFTRNEEAQHHLLCRSALQVRLSSTTGALILGDEFFQAVYRHIAPWVSRLVHDEAGVEPGPRSIALSETFLDVLSLDFAPSDIDAFAAIRGSDEISDYTRAFRKAIGAAQEAGHLRSNLLRLMREAMESERVSQMAAGALETTGSIVNLAGLVPVIGTIASITGAGADVVGRVATRKAESHRWYLLGSKMREIALRDLLKRD